MSIIRLSRQGDGPVVRKLLPMTLDVVPPEAWELVGAADAGYPDMRELRLNRSATGRTKDTTHLVSLRIAEEDGQPVGMAYAAPPLGWIVRRSGLNLNQVARLTGRLAELEMLAVLPRYRGNGHGEALLKDVIERYRAEGYTVLLVIADKKVVPYYERYGFTFAQPGDPFRVVFWRGRQLSALYQDLDAPQALGMLPLADTVQVTRPDAGPPVISGLLD